MSSVSTNLALTVRKALSLCFSVWWFGSGWNARFAMGASMVFSGSLAYAAVGQTSTHSNETEPAGPAKGSGKEKVA